EMEEMGAVAAEVVGAELVDEEDSRYKSGNSGSKPSYNMSSRYCSTWIRRCNSHCKCNYKDSSYNNNQCPKFDCTDMSYCNN
ncbi:MAG TPA: hypothetical protein VJ488_00385, partial [Dehalococcoidia bacterium]|nr:hypothetical protein [Dehalococcoidia bacterium]